MSGTESYVQPPPDNTSGPKLATQARTLVASTSDGPKHHYALIHGEFEKIAQYTLTRSTDITTYSAGDALTATSSGGSISGHSYLDIARDNGGGGKIIGAICVDSANSTTLKPAFDLFLFNGNAATTANSDNAQFFLATADAQKCVAVISFTTDSWFSGTSGSSGTSVGFGTIRGGGVYTCGTCGNDLYGLTVMRNAYTPIASEVLLFSLQVKMD